MSARVRALVVALVFVGVGLLPDATAADAHGFSTVVYVHAAQASDHVVRVKLGLEYDLTIVSVATREHDDPLYRAGQPAWDNGNFRGMVAAVDKHRASLSDYVLARFGVATAGGSCVGRMQRSLSVTIRDGVPYANTVFDFDCPPTGETDKGHVVHSALFPDREHFVSGAKAVVVYTLDGKNGTAALDADHPSFSTEQTWYQRFGEFFRLGAEHLLTGIDHILFLLALIVGSRRLREIVLAATTFTLAHSVTFILAALGIVHPPSGVVEPIIALSIAGVAAWYLYRLARRRGAADELDTTGGSHLDLDRAGWSRLGIVFVFGLVHGLGFASALGIDSSFSFELLWSLLVFNVGIEAVQIAIIIAVFPGLALLRRYHHTAYLWVTGVVAGGVSVVGLVWFVQRVVAGG